MAISPLAQRGLDEAFRLAVGLRAVSAREFVRDPELGTRVSEVMGAESGTVVCKQAQDRHAQCRKIVGRGV